MGQMGFRKIVRVPAVFCENLQLPAVFCENLCLPNAVISKKTDHLQKSARICEKLRIWLRLSLFIPLIVDLYPEWVPPPQGYVPYVF